MRDVVPFQISVMLFMSVCGMRLSFAKMTLGAPLFFPVADLGRSERIDLRADVDVFDVNLLGTYRVFPTAQTELQCRYAHFIVDVGVGPDAGAKSVRNRRLLATHAFVGLFDDFDQCFYALFLIAHQRSVHLHIIVNAGCG